MVYTSANFSSLWLHYNVSLFDFCFNFFRPQLLQLTEEFDRLLNSDSFKPTLQVAKFDTKKDLFSLGTLLDVCKNSSISSYPSTTNSAGLQEFITLCQSAKSIEQLVDHKYLTQGMIYATTACVVVRGSVKIGK